MFPVITLLLATLILPAPALLHSAPLTVPKPLAVLGTVDRVLTTVDLSGDGVPERIEFRADRRTFSVQTGKLLWSADPLGVSDRILIWDFDQLRRGVEFVYVGIDQERSNLSVDVFGARAFRWDEQQKTYSDPFYAYVRILVGKPAEVGRVLDIAQQAFLNWLGRRERAWQMLTDLRAAVMAGKAVGGFFMPNAVRPKGWSAAITQASFEQASYSEDEWEPVSYISGMRGNRAVIVIFKLDRIQRFRVAQIKLE